MWTPCGRSSYVTCQTWPLCLAKHGEIGPSKTWKSSQTTHGIAEGMRFFCSNGSNEQRTHKLKQYLSGHCMVNPVSKFLNYRPKDQAASTLESTFLFWRRFMTLLEIHLLQMCKCCEAALDVEIWARHWTTCYLNLKQRHLCNLQILRWLTRQAKLPLLRGWHGTWNKSPLAMKCQVNNQKSRTALAQYSWIATWIANRLR